MDKKEKPSHLKGHPEKEEEPEETDPLDNEEEKDPKEEIMEQMRRGEDRPQAEDSPEDEDSQEQAPQEETKDEPGSSAITTEELLHNDLPKADNDEEDYSGSNADISHPSKEHTLDDLAAEEERLPLGVEPSRPKSFMMDEDGSPRNLNQHIPSSGVYGRKGPKNSRKKSLALLIIALLVIGGIVYLFKGRLGAFGGGTASPSPSATTAETLPSETPTPTPSVDRSKYTVDILNGSGKTGLAASVSSKLKGLGYQEGKVGNATNSAFTRTVVLSKDSAKEAVDTLIKDLAPDFDATSGGVLKDSATSDLEVILGAK